MGHLDTKRHPFTIHNGFPDNAIRTFPIPVKRHKGSFSLRALTNRPFATFTQREVVHRWQRDIKLQNGQSKARVLGQLHRNILFKQ